MNTAPRILKPVLFLLVTLMSIFSKAQSIATYDISLTTIWNTTSHTSVPGGAHWSPLIGATHNTTNEFLNIGDLATLGIKNVAEIGNNSEFINEINSAIGASKADKVLQDGFSPSAGNNSNASFSGITISEFFPLVTLVSMVAPSPDWFIAINSLNMRSGNPTVNNGWKETFTMDVFAYDAGTDNGTDYGSGDAPSSPFVPVTMVSGFPINGNKMATITFTYKSSTLGIDDALIKRLKVYPNPATEVINITNFSPNSIETIELYNILGKRVNATISRSENAISINVKNLQSGVYILNINKVEGNSTTRKVIIE